jgi:hypothetical protein
MISGREASVQGATSRGFDPVVEKDDRINESRGAGSTSPLRFTPGQQYKDIISQDNPF